MKYGKIVKFKIFVRRSWTVTITPIQRHSKINQIKVYFNFSLIPIQLSFLDRIDEITTEGYVPTEDDIIRCRIITRSVSQLQYSYRNREFM